MADARRHAPRHRCADVLREWQGLGYPRRARGLHDTATVVAKGGWPDTEEGLLALPGVGRYTARALRVLAFGDSVVPPQDVNIARVTARAALGKEPGDVRLPVLEEQLAAGRPKGMTARTFTYALFDVGALHCKAKPLCHGCPLASLVRVARPARRSVADARAAATGVPRKHSRTARRRAARHARRSPARFDC